VGAVLDVGVAGAKETMVAAGLRSITVTVGTTDATGEVTPEVVSFAVVSSE
jgi:hypothetical protein